MDVNFNNVRKQTCWAYDKLARKLNESIDDTWGEKEIKIKASEIQDIMDNLRGLIMTSAWVYKQGDDDFRVVGDEVGEITWFNSEQEDED